MLGVLPCFREYQFFLSNFENIHKKSHGLKSAKRTGHFVVNLFSNVLSTKNICTLLYCIKFFAHFTYKKYIKPYVRGNISPFVENCSKFPFVRFPTEHAILLYGYYTWKNMGTYPVQKHVHMHIRHESQRLKFVSCNPEILRPFFALINKPFLKRELLRYGNLRPFRVEMSKTSVSTERISKRIGIIQGVSETCAF